MFRIPRRVPASRKAYPPLRPNSNDVRTRILILFPLQQSKPPLAELTIDHCLCFPAHAAFPKWQEGRHPHCHFRGLLRFHSRTARRIAQPPKAAFVTRLQPCRLPGRAARQLPDQPTTLRVESSSTSDARLLGALPITEQRSLTRSLMSKWPLRGPNGDSVHIHCHT